MIISFSQSQCRSQKNWGSTAVPVDEKLLAPTDPLALRSYMSVKELKAP
jgi:hypothetical protein